MITEKEFIAAKRAEYKAMKKAEKIAIKLEKKICDIRGMGYKLIVLGSKVKITLAK